MLLLTKGNSLEEVKWKVYSKGTFSLKLHFSIFSVWLLAYLIFVTGTRGGARGENLVMWRNLST